jgi:hypothetical protein
VLHRLYATVLGCLPYHRDALSLLTFALVSGPRLSAIFPYYEALEGGFAAARQRFDPGGRDLHPFGYPRGEPLALLVGKAVAKPPAPVGWSRPTLPFALFVRDERGELPRGVDHIAFFRSFRRPLVQDADGLAFATRDGKRGR